MRLHNFVLLLTILPLVFGRENKFTDQNKISHNYDDILNWDAPKEFQDNFRYYLAGHDYENRPLVIVEHGKWHTRAIAERGGEALITLKNMTDQLVQRVRSGYYCEKLNLSDTNCHDSEHVTIFDYEGMDLNQYKSPGNIQYLLSLYPKLDKIYSQFEYGFMINVNPLAEKLLQLGKPLAAKFLDRMEIHGTNKRKWMPRILRKIPRDQLPEQYGGYKSFKPIEFYG